MVVKQHVKWILYNLSLGDELSSQNDSDNPQKPVGDASAKNGETSLSYVILPLSTLLYR